MDRIQIPIQGMSCGGCVRSVEQILARLPGVRVESVSVGAAVVSIDPAVTDRSAIATAIERGGFVVG